MLAAYEQVLLLIEATDPERSEVMENPISGVWNQAVEGGIKAMTAIEIPELMIPDIPFGIGNGVNGMPGVVFYPEDVIEKIQ